MVLLASDVTVHSTATIFLYFFCHTYDVSKDHCDVVVLVRQGDLRTVGVLDVEHIDKFRL